MRWDDTYKGDRECYAWHDLLDDDDGLLGYVRENLVDHTYVAHINDMARQSKKFKYLEDAKAHIVAYYVAQKLEGA